MFFHFFHLYFNFYFPNCPWLSSRSFLLWIPYDILPYHIVAIISKGLFNTSHFLILMSFFISPYPALSHRSLFEITLGQKLRLYSLDMFKKIVSSSETPLIVIPHVSMQYRQTDLMLELNICILNSHLNFDFAKKDFQCCEVLSCFLELTPPSPSIMLPA